MVAEQHPGGGSMTPAAGSSGPGAPDPAASHDRRRWAGLFFVSLGVAMIIVDATIVNVAIPAIITDLGITSSDAQWVQEVYTLVFAALLLSVGRLADKWGRRALFLVGVVVFTTASVLAAVSGTPTELIGARVLQGVGGAFMLPTSLSLLNATFRGKERAIAFAVWGSTIGGTAALGPLLGGWLTTSYSWRWAFGINVPIAILVVVGVLTSVRESRDATEKAGVDVPGTLLSVFGVAGVVFGLIEGRTYGWWGLRRPFSLFGVDWTWDISPAPVAIILGALALVAFLVVERRRARAGRVVLLDLTLFSIPSFRNGNIAVSIVSLGEFGILFALPLWLQFVRGQSAFDTGVALLPLALGSFLASGFGAQMANRRGPATVVRLGIFLEIVGVAGIGFVISPTTSTWELAPLLLIYGMGVGLATAQVTGVVLGDVPVQQSGQASGTQSTMRQLGSAFGIAILGTALFTSMAASLDNGLADQGLPAEARDGIVTAVADSAGAAIPGLVANPQTAQIGAAAQEALSHGAQVAAFTGAAFLTLGLIAARSLGSGRQAPAGARPVAAGAPPEPDAAPDQG